MLNKILDREGKKMMNEHTRRNILIDTSIAVEGGEAIIAKLEKIAPVFVTDIVLQELDGHKINANGAVAFQARTLFKRFGKDNGVELHVMPLSNMPLEKGDTLRKMTLGSTPLYVLVRKFYKSRDINDSKIIEIAKDYNMTLVTLDMAQRVRAVSEGVDVFVIEEKSDNKEKGFSMFKFVFFFVVCLCIAPIVYFNFDLFVSKSIVENVVFSIVVLFCLLLLFLILNYAFSNRIKENASSKEYKDFESIKSDNWVTDPSKSFLNGNLFHETLH